MGTHSDPKDPMESSQAAPLPSELQGQIGKKLRESYSELVSEPIPDRFLQLLQELKSKEAPEQASKEASRTGGGS